MHNICDSQIIKLFPISEQYILYSENFGFFREGISTEFPKTSENLLSMHLMKILNMIFANKNRRKTER